MSRHVDVVTLGEAMVLLDPADSGSLEVGGQFTARVAGAESNTAIGLARLGVLSAWISAVGGDPFGRFVVSTLAAEGVDVSSVRTDPARPTGVFFKERMGASTRVYYYRAGSAAAGLTPADVPIQLIRESRLLHLSGITIGLSNSARASVRKAVEGAKKARVLISVDPNLRDGLPESSGLIPAIAELLENADIVLGGLEELEAVLGVTTPEDVFARLRAKVVVVRLGPNGSLVSVRGGPVARLTAVDVDVVDQVGAGDAFNSGFLAATLRGHDPTSAAQIGGVVASYTVQSTGDWETIPGWDEVIARSERLGGVNVARSDT